MTYISSAYYDNIAHGRYSNIASWSKIGYNPNIGTSEEDLWSAGGTYTFPAAAGKWEVVSSDNTQDIGTVIKGDATGDTVQADAGGSTTTLVDASVDFTAVTAVAVGDLLILDPHGTTPEWGYVTTVAANTLTCANGFSSGGTGASRYYAVVDKSAYTNAQAVKLEYLTDAYAQKSEIVVLNGTTAVDTVNTDIYRVNSFRVIGTGTSNVPLGNLTLRADGGGTTYSYITAGYTRACNIAYTVPAAKTLYVTAFTVGWSYSSATAKNEYVRFYTRANVEPSTRFLTGSLFYPYTEVDMDPGSQEVILPVPTKLPAKTDIRVCAVASATGGIGSVVLRGYLVS